jgi:hypothetical protein
VKVKVTGAAAKIDALFRFDKAIWKEIQTGVKDAAESVASDARTRVPAVGLTSSRSGWTGWGKWIAAESNRNLSYEQSIIRGSIKPRFQSRVRGGLRVVKGQAVVMNPAGAIFMLAGSQNRSGHAFNRVMNRQNPTGVWPRVLTPAYYAKGPQARRDIADAIERAIAQVNQAG